MEFLFFVHIRLVHMHGYHFGLIHHMGTQIRPFHDPAFNIDGALRDHGCFYNIRLLPCQMHFFPLIYVFPASYAAKIHGPDKGLRCQVHNKLPRLFYHMVRITLFPHRNRQHRRIRTGGSGPRDRQDIIPPLSVRAAYHDRRQRIQHISRFPCYFRHGCNSSLSHRFTYIPKPSAPRSPHWQAPRSMSGSILL